MFREIRLGQKKLREKKAKISPVKAIKMGKKQSLEITSPEQSAAQHHSHMTSKMFIQDLIEKINSQTKYIIQQKMETERFHDS